MKLDVLVDKVVTNIFYPIAGIMGTLALAYFIWGIIEMMMKSDDETALDTGRQHIMYGTLGLTIIVGVYSIMKIIIAFIST